jgi:hypothetical protein
MLTFYVLSKGVTTSIEVDKKALSSGDTLYEGALVYCTKFEKRDGYHYLIKYKLAEKFEIQNQELTER